MIIGQGIDIVEIARIEGIITRLSDRFLEKVFTPSEITFCQSKARPAAHFSARWAIKEAFYKALPSAIQKISFWKSIEYIPPSPNHHRSIIVLCDSKLKEVCKAHGVMAIHASVSHERAMCVGIVTLDGKAI